MYEFKISFREVILRKYIDNNIWYKILQSVHWTFLVVPFKIIREMPLLSIENYRSPELSIDWSWNGLQNGSKKGFESITMSGFRNPDRSFL